jgi:hypothetical protein
VPAGTLVGPEEMTGDEMMAAIDADGVGGAVLVSPFSMYRYDASYVLQVEAKRLNRFWLVKPVDPNDPAVADITMRARLEPPWIEPERFGSGCQARGEML